MTRQVLSPHPCSSPPGRGLIAVPIVLLSAVMFGACSAVADCIDYRDYLHWAGNVGTPGHACDVAISGTHAYVADESSGLQVIDVRPVPALQPSGSPEETGPGLVGAEPTQAVFLEHAAFLDTGRSNRPAAPRSARHRPVCSWWRGGTMPLSASRPARIGTGQPPQLRKSQAT
jgi:hypothetical protein